MGKILLITLAAIVAGCASKPPEAISRIPAQDLSLTLVRLDIDRYLGAEVRWGGVISKVENRADQTWVEIVRQKLRDNGRPGYDGRSDGRFIASFDKFVDPVVYTVGRPLTVVGTIDGKISRPIGDFDYLFPVVKVEGSFLWKPVAESPPPGYYPPPWWYYDPWFYPPWPYHRHPRFY
ncbi:MAG: Slp family lipoprotein [Gammaproteobacteria bacterium]|nr:Slp family lipoprotein [Gammaproteobacteria bacterium]MDH3536951.1 Slp family lipoprotein [Gammaproteobacteria bacterium]